MPFSVEYSWSLTQQDDSEIALDLGQCIKHKKNNYHGIVVGYDRECTQTEEWCKKNGVDALARGRAQPFYNVLVDRKDRPGATMTYVAQENLDRSPARIIEHPFFTTASFTGEVDAAAGVWKPTPMLREQYPRGLDGCWLVDEVAPERSREERLVDGILHPGGGEKHGEKGETLHKTLHKTLPHVPKSVASCCTPFGFLHHLCNLFTPPAPAPAPQCSP